MTVLEVINGLAVCLLLIAETTVFGGNVLQNVIVRLVTHNIEFLLIINYILDLFFAKLLSYYRYLLCLFLQLYEHEGLLYELMTLHRQ